VALQRGCTRLYLYKCALGLPLDIPTNDPIEAQKHKSFRFICMRQKRDPDEISILLGVAISVVHYSE